EEMQNLAAEIERITNILANRDLLIDLIIDELTEIKNKYADERRTVIDKNISASINDEDLISKRDIVITTSTKGYVKRIDLEEYKTQR
ncbi:DNA gyrase subunit A, partial [Xanthomonas citri pv. citri]|nr:DNA gyrase subunit A [Xanthomonas citri pv. citri]